MNKYGTSVIYVEKFFKFNFSNHVIYSIVIHNLPQDTSCDIFILYFHFIFSFHRKTHLRCISSVLLHYNCNINANIEDVYHRPNLERAPKGRLPLVHNLFGSTDQDNLAVDQGQSDLPSSKDLFNLCLHTRGDGVHGHLHVGLNRGESSELATHET